MKSTIGLLFAGAFLMFASALALAAALTGEAALGSNGTISRVPEIAAQSSIVQVQAKKQRKKRGESKGRRPAASCRDRCMTKKNPASCEQRCHAGQSED